MPKTLTALLICLPATLCAQSFEVAAIKPSDPSKLNGSSGMNTGHGSLTASNVTLKRCIMGAFGIGQHQIVGGPPWLDSDRFEIVAKAEEPLNDDSVMNTMIQNLLADRFQLAFHRETRPMQALVLEVVKGGPKLEKAAAEEESTTSGNNSRGLLVARATSMAHLAEVLGRSMDLPVVDHTGLQGSYNLKLEWTPESSAKPPTDSAASDAGLSIFTALQQQLGLRLRAQKVPIEMFVIDRAERPSAN